MRIGIGAFAGMVALAITGVSHGAPVLNYSATFTGLTNNNGAFEALGVASDTDQLTFYWTVDAAAAPLEGPISQIVGGGSRDYAYLPYQSFRVEIGGLTLTAADSTSSRDAILISDAKADGTIDLSDAYFVRSTTRQSLTGGITLTGMEVQVFNHDHTIIDDLSHPTPDQLNNWGGSILAFLQISHEDGSGGSIQSSAGSFAQIGVVPVPAGLPLLGSAILLLAAVRRFRSRAVA